MILWTYAYHFDGIVNLASYAWDTCMRGDIIVLVVGADCAIHAIEIWV
jgi:hypothetical protein